MTDLPNIEKCVETCVLWPPIADALSAYIRRRAAGADGFELTWRLIHVWESTAIVLGAAITTRLRDLGMEGADAYLTCREILHGRTFDSATGGLKKGQGGLDGSAGRRIELLQSLNRAATPNSKFLESAKSLLQGTGVDLQPLLFSWRLVCDAPRVASDEKLRLQEVFRHVNTFRNRFAHVPFPYDEVAGIADALALATEQMFSLEPLAWQLFADDRPNSPLQGGIVFRGRRMVGSAPPALVESSSAYFDEPYFFWPALPWKKEAPQREIWNGQPFLMVDSMFRPSILTRLVSEANATLEYTRFLAERSSVIQIDDSKRLSHLPVPTLAEYPQAQDEQEDMGGISQESEVPPNPTERDSAERATRDISNEDYEAAAARLRLVVAERPNYHIAWFRLGYALREEAMRRRFEHPELAASLFQESLSALTKASAHRVLGWQAQALYERSKVYFHTGEYDQAMKDAANAFAKVNEPKYANWIEYLERHPPSLGLSS